MPSVMGLQVIDLSVLSSDVYVSVDEELCLRRRILNWYFHFHLAICFVQQCYADNVLCTMFRSDLIWHTYSGWYNRSDLKLVVQPLWSWYLTSGRKRMYRANNVLYCFLFCIL